MGVLKKWKCQWPCFCNSAITTHFQDWGLNTRRTFRKNWLKSLLDWVQLLAVSEEVFKILTLQDSAAGPSWLAYFNSQGFCLAKGSQQLSLWSQLVVKEYKLSCVVLKVRVRKRRGRFSAVPSKFASTLSLKIVWRRFSLELNKANYWQFWLSWRQSAGEVGWGFSSVLDLSFK